MEEKREYSLWYRAAVFAYFSVCLLIDLILLAKMLGIRSHLGSLVYLLLGIGIEMGAPFLLERFYLRRKTLPFRQILRFKGAEWRKDAAVLIGLVTLVLILLRVVYEVRYDSFWTDLPNGKTAVMEVDLDAEYYSEYVFGSLAKEETYLLINGKQYENGDILKLKVGDTIDGQVGFAVTTERANITAKANALEMPIPLHDGEDSGVSDILLQPDQTLNQGMQLKSTAEGTYMKADITVKLTRIPTFWRVVFH
ncbi:MAG: hypothetical protein Q4B22_06190 [Eubacteriales bacterium]|nr:hypothetical protein [Eubacteriales bacterium]